MLQTNVHSLRQIALQKLDAQVQKIYKYKKYITRSPYLLFLF